MIIISSDFISESIMKLDFHSQYKLNKQQLVSEVVLNFLLVQKFKSIKIIRKKGLGNKHQYYPSEFIKNKHWILSSLIITTLNGRAHDSSGKVWQTAWGDAVCVCSALRGAGLCRSRLDLTSERRLRVQGQLLPCPEPPKNWIAQGEGKAISNRPFWGKTSSCSWLTLRSWVQHLSQNSSAWTWWHFGRVLSYNGEGECLSL